MLVHGQVAEWYTRNVEVVVGEILCRFKSCLAHHKDLVSKHISYNPNLNFGAVRLFYYLKPWYTIKKLRARE